MSLRPVTEPRTVTVEVREDLLWVVLLAAQAYRQHTDDERVRVACVHVADQLEGR
jgi:hypothetical protein